MQSKLSIQNFSVFAVVAVVAEEAVVRAVSSTGAALVREKRIGKMVRRVRNCILEGWCLVDWLVG